MRNKKKWSGWFVPLAKGKREGPLTWTMVQVSDEKISRAQILPRKQKSKTRRIKLVISVPASCGNAVQRNRFRRMVRGFFTRRNVLDQISISRGLWIRLSAHHRLSKQSTLAEWVAPLEKIQETLLKIPEEKLAVKSNGVSLK